MPIFDIENKVNYALSISLSTARLQQHDRGDIIQSLIEAGKSISYELGYYAEYPLLFDN